MFQVPSTPDSSRYRDDDAPSTTPAGPPPTDFTSQSFTPAGPPPSSVFGSSLGPDMTIAKSAFKPTGQLNSPSIKGPLHTNPAGTKRGYFFPESSPPREMDQDSNDGRSEEDADGEELGQSEYLANERQQNRRSDYSRDEEDDESDFLDLPRGAKRSRNGEVMAASMRSSRIVGARHNREPMIPGLTKGLAATLPTKSAIEETDDLVLNTEAVLNSLDASLKTSTEDELDTAIGRAAQHLSREWSKYTDKESLPAAIGPVQKSGLTRAAYIASLLFHIHHPTAASSDQRKTNNAFGRSSRLTSLVPRTRHAQPVPKSLMDWLNEYHNPYPDDTNELVQCRPSPTAHDRFWDIVFATMLRGNVTLTVQILSKADFSHADTALEDGYDEPGYRGRQLTSIQYVVAQCADLLKTCPAFTDGDWDVKNTEWALFRNRARRALEDLEAYAEEGNADRDSAPGNVFQASKTGGSFSAASRRAESKVPWTIYEQLKTLYGQLLGYREEILLSAQDWLEAVIYLTSWWDGEDDEIPKGSLAAGRRSLRYAQHTRQVDVAPVSAYKRRMLSAFASVTDDPEDPLLAVNTVDPVQVALACVFEDDIEGVVSILRKWSLPVVAAAVDVASAGGWLPEGRSRSGGVIDGFDQSDLMVLSHGQSQEKTGLDRDEVLGAYADMLAKREEYASSDGQNVREGWEMAVRVSSRLNSADAAERRIGQMFDRMTFESTQQVDKALAVCNELGLAGQVRKISERYANSLAESTHSYGEAIIYYARGHSVQQLRSTLDLLISMSLVQSAAYPAASALDRQLNKLLNDQRTTLNQLARVDIEAAQLIADHLSGYATLRKFYELRDESDDDDESRKSGLRPFARKREAARAITALIGSAADTIRGGLYDSDTAAVVQVDTLLALLGEALPLMEQTKPLLKQSQLMTLLRATEDLQTVSSRIYEQAETLLQAAMSDYNGSRVVSPQDLSKSMSKSVSNLAGSSYGMVNSHGSIESENRMDVGQDESTRGWDWRKGLATVAGKNAQGEDVLRILRVQVAKEMARAWSETL